jgi:hypothetical protein
MPQIKGGTKIGRKVNGGQMPKNLGSGTYKSMTSKTIAPPPYDLPPPDKKRLRNISETSAWTPGDIYVRDFGTQQCDSYMNPSVYLTSMDAADEAVVREREKWEKGRQSQRRVALEKLSGVARLKYGNMANMLRAFKKNTSDTITLPEFAEHLRRRNMDSMLPLEDQELIWEQLKCTARGSIGVGNLSKAVDETAGSDKFDQYSKDARDMLELRNFLAEEVAKKREKLGPNEIQVSGGLEGEGDTLKNALGQKTFDLDIGAEEMDDVVEGLFQKKHTKNAHEKFSRFLRLTNVKLHAIPFYDLRSDELARLKLNAKKLSSELMQPGVTSTLNELKTAIKNKRDEDYLNSVKWKAEAEARVEAKLAPFISSPIRAPRDSSTSSNSTTVNSYRSNIGTGGSGQNTLTPLSGSRSLPVLTSGFGENAFDNSIEQQQDLPESTAASVLYGDMDPSMYNSTYTEYYPPLNYEPNKPITRDTVSDADKKCKLRNLRRQLRQKRTEANTKVTKDRLNLEKLSSLSKQLKGEHGRTEDMIRYQTTVFLHDLKCYKKQPLQTMAKKPNLTKSDAMWGGSQKFDDAADSYDGRDFNTTFRSSFHANPPKSEPTINLEARITAMGFE